MSYQNALEELNKNLQLYLQNKCDAPTNNLSKAINQLTSAIEADFKEQRRQIKALRDAVSRMESSR